MTDRPLAFFAQEIRTLKLEGIVTANDLMASPAALVGSTDKMVEQLEAGRERWGISYIGILGDMNAIAPVVARLAGR